MEPDWITFVLEIVNFLILVWLLKRFLYRPVQDFVAQRRAGIDQTLDEAHRAHAEADALRDHYENRLADWAQERENALAGLHAEMEQERARRLEILKQTLAEEQEKARVVEERRRQEISHHAEQTALALAARFAARLLERTADPQTTGNLARLLTEELGKLSQEQQDALRQAARNGSGPLRLQSAHPLDDAQRAALESAFTRLLDTAPEWNYQVDPALVAGVRIALGPWVLAASLKDELKAFADLAHDASRS